MKVFDPGQDTLAERLDSYLCAIADIHHRGADNRAQQRFSIQRVYGGANNALYKIEAETETLACKLCVDDGRQRAAREFGTLQTLHNAQIDIAPEPILLAEHKSILPYPLVVYRWVSGTCLPARLSAEQLSAFLHSYQQLHSLRSEHFPAFQLDAWFHWFDFEVYLSEICELAKQYTPWLAKATSEGRSLRDRLWRLIENCKNTIAKTEISPRRTQIPLRLMRVDSNKANAILGLDGQIRWVDWEYGGWGDPALDIAELRWHAALQPLGMEALQWLRTNYQPPTDDPEFGERIKIWDHILATRWPFLILRALWSKHNGPDRERLSQVETSAAQFYRRLRNYIALAESLFAGKSW